MGQGGCITGEAVQAAVFADNDVDTISIVKGFNSICSAFTSLTSSKNAATKVAAHRSAGLRRRTYHAGQTHTWEEIAQHNSDDSCWIVIKDKVYDVTEFAPSHPGGRAIIAYAGRDATDVFSTFHASATWSKLKTFYIGDVEDPLTPGMLKDFRAMRLDLIKQGLFASSKVYYALKVITTLGLIFTAASVLIGGQNTWASCFLGAFMLGLGWQQSGWLCHDFCHHQVFKNRKLNNAMSYFLGNVVQGFSVDWWKNKHNTHHAVPNECSAEALALDPDIDTLPLLAWHTDMLRHVTPGQESLLRVQHYIFFPILCFARISWAQQSVAHAALLSTVTKQGRLEVALLGVHYALQLTLAFTTLSLPKALVFLLASQVFAGFMLALVFVQSHNGMEVYTEPKDFVSAQIVSTRDIESNLWMDWFTGGLNYQIEHHLFPTMPRHNLGKARAATEAFCARHDFVYETCSMGTGTHRVLHRLAEIAAQI